MQKFISVNMNDGFRIWTMVSGFGSTRQADFRLMFITVSLVGAKFKEK